MKLVLVLVAFLACCGGDEAGELRTSLELSFRLSAQDVDGDGTLVDQSPIDVSEEAPWRAFADSIESSFAGAPGDLFLDSVAMEVLETSSGVGTLGEVFNGPVALKLGLGGSEYSLAVADIRQSNSNSLLEAFIIEFDYSRIAAAEQARIIAGDMQVLFVGQAGENFRNSNSAADIRCTLDFRASPPAEDPSSGL